MKLATVSLRCAPLLNQYLTRSKSMVKLSSFFRGKYVPSSSMNLPSRGLRPSATTIRNAGLFFAPTRFNRILTAINYHSLLGWPHPDHPPFKGFPEKRCEPRLGSATLQALFLRFL